MRNLSKGEIAAARAEVKPTADELAAETLRIHTESLRPRAHVEADVFPGCMSDTRPRWNGKLQPPTDGGR